MGVRTALTIYTTLFDIKNIRMQIYMRDTNDY